MTVLLAGKMDEYLMFDLATMAFQSDLTRVVTILPGREGSLRTCNEVGVSEGHHPLSHHRNRNEWLDKLSIINPFHAPLTSEFIAKLKSAHDADGTVLDQSMVLFGSGLTDSNRRINDNLPILLRGV